MAEKTEKKAEAPAPPKEAPRKEEAASHGSGGGMMSKTPVMLGVVMLLEAVVLFAGFKFLGGGPKNAVAVTIGEEKEKGGHGESGHGEPGTNPADKKKLAEINVLDFRAPNNQNGRRFIYDVSIFIAVKGEYEQKVKDILKERDALVKDRIRTIIAQMDPERLGGGSEPGLETLRRQVKAQLELILGDDMIDEVLVPRCIPFRADF